jgi:hypothetical protein
MRSEARAAIAQTETEITNAKIAELQRRALDSEAREAWQEAVEDYDAIVLSMRTCQQSIAR